MTPQDVFASRDLDAFVELLGPAVVWRGMQPGAVCDGRRQVRESLERFPATGNTSRPEISAESAGRVLVDQHPEPPPELAPELHQVFTMSGGKAVRIDDHPNRRSGLRALESGE